jgi:hypothetical protein
MDLVRQEPTIEKVVVVDDDPKCLAAFAAMASQLAASTGQTVRIVDALAIVPPLCTDGPASAFLSRRGLLRHPRDAANARHAISFVVDTWAQALRRHNELATAELGSQLAAPYGGYALGRAGDVDLCLLAPCEWELDRCCTAMRDELTNAGIAWIYVAHSSRCPRLRLRLSYSNYAPIEVDLVFAAVVDNGGRVDKARVFSPKPLPNGVGDASNGADGVAYSAFVLQTLRQRGMVNPEAFGMAVEVAVAVLSARNVKGNHFHALRTCHLVELARKAVEAGDLLGRGRITADRIFHATVQLAASMSTEDWCALVGDRCPLQLLEKYRTVWSSVADVIHKVGSSAVSVQTYEELCRPALFPADGFRAVNWTTATSSSDPIATWRADIYARARFPTAFRRLLDDNKHTASTQPGPTINGSTLSIAIPDSEDALASLQNCFKSFVGDMATHFGGELVVGDVGETVPSCRRLPANASESCVAAVDAIDRMSDAFGQHDAHELLPMSASERSLVHNYAKKMGLESSSTGEGSKRRVVISKK